MLLQRITRNRRKGLGVVAAMFFLGVMVLPLFGLLSFEVSRAMIMQAQLKHACEAAALAGVARMASSDDLSTTTTHLKSIQLAKEIFRMNTINQYSLSSAADASSNGDNPPANSSSVFVQFLDNSGSPVTVGNTNGKVVHVIGAWGLMPVFGGWGFFGLGGPYPIRAEGHGRVPDLDITMAFDTSGSIDDQTSIQLICCYWDNASAASGGQRIKFRRAQNGSKIGNGRLWDLVANGSATGTNHSAYWIQNLSDSGSDFGFNANVRNKNSLNGPPGNYRTTGAAPVSPGPLPTGCGYADPGINQYTHQVINTKFNSSTFAASDSNAAEGYPMTFGTVTVRNISEHVALSAGWLDSGAAASTARISTAPEITLTTGTAATRSMEYENEVQKHLHPIREAQDAAQTFFTIMNNNTDSHFGVTCFNDSAKTSPSGTKGGESIDSGWSIGVNHTRPDFGIALSSTVSNFSTIMPLLPQTCAQGSTDIAGAINRCKSWMDSGKRPGTFRTIIVFTDGAGTVPSAGAAKGAAHSAADTCRTPGYTINSIGLSQNKNIVKNMCDVLNEGAGVPIQIPPALLGGGISTSPYTPTENGVAKRGGLIPPGKFYLVSDGQSLRYVFENLARRLCQLVKVD
ncbi:MAG: hypothetical protein K2X29_07025 [Candidatus Obscuribacterales bacterium]|nr:hypothetical protein [Candidatus Obscuribacterales bacterium]